MENQGSTLMTSPPSPFSQKRFEHAGYHVYFLPQNALEQLERQRPAYLVGSRGTGKTTLLKALSWQERLHSASLRAQLPDGPFAARYVGTYLKLPEFHLELIDRWLRDEDDLIHAAVFSVYVDLVCLEAITNAFAGLNEADVLSFSIEEEARAVDAISEWWHTYGAPASLVAPTEPASLTQLHRAVTAARVAIERAATGRVSPSTAVTGLPTGKIGALGRFAGETLATLTPVEAPWHIRACLDEGEVLSRRQQIVLNTMVRLASTPLFYVVAFAAMPQDVSTTLLPNQTLSADDRELIIRDEMDDEEFSELAEGVASVRVRHVLSDELARVDVDALLGDLDLNQWAYQQLSRSVREKGRDLLERARAYQGPRQGLPSTSGPPQVLEAYMDMVAGETQVSPNSAVWQRRRDTSSGIRKKQVSAYLAFCEEFGLRPRYASGTMLRQMSDKCIRDFLSQMHALFVEYAGPLQDFLQAEMPVDAQDRALRSASAAKRDSIGRRITGAAPDEARNVVDGLATVTAKIQRTVASSERGVFVIRREDFGDETNLDLLRDASQAGYLRVERDDSDAFRFRVHTSLAAAYEFSYRGAYYDVRLAAAEISALRSAQSIEAQQQAVTTIVNRLTSIDPAQTRLDGMD